MFCMPACSCMHADDAKIVHNRNAHIKLGNQLNTALLRQFLCTFTEETTAK